MVLFFSAGRGTQFKTKYSYWWNKFTYVKVSNLVVKSSKTIECALCFIQNNAVESNRSGPQAAKEGERCGQCTTETTEITSEHPVQLGTSCVKYIPQHDLCSDLLPKPSKMFCLCLLLSVSNLGYCKYSVMAENVQIQIDVTLALFKTLKP